LDDSGLDDGKRASRKSASKLCKMSISNFVSNLEIAPILKMCLISITLCEDASFGSEDCLFICKMIRVGTPSVRLKCLAAQAEISPRRTYAGGLEPTLDLIKRDRD
jgi:hypothetical protein